MMNDWKGCASVLVAIPVLALFGGIGIMAFRIADTWDVRNTDVMISGLVSACGIGGIAIAGILGAIIGIPFSMRIWDRWREADREDVRGPRVIDMHRQLRPDMPQLPMRDGPAVTRGGQFDMLDSSDGWGESLDKWVE